MTPASPLASGVRSEGLSPLSRRVTLIALVTVPYVVLTNGLIFGLVGLYQIATFTVPVSLLWISAGFYALPGSYAGFVLFVDRRTRVLLVSASKDGVRLQTKSRQLDLPWGSIAPASRAPVGSWTTLLSGGALSLWVTRDQLRTILDRPESPARLFGDRFWGWLGLPAPIARVPPGATSSPGNREMRRIVTEGPLPAPLRGALVLCVLGTLLPVLTIPFVGISRTGRIYGLMQDPAPGLVVYFGIASIWAHTWAWSLRRPAWIEVGPHELRIAGRLGITPRIQVVPWALLQPGQRAPGRNSGAIRYRLSPRRGGTFDLTKEQLEAVLTYPEAPESHFPPEYWAWLGLPTPSYTR